MVRVRIVATECSVECRVGGWPHCYVGTTYFSGFIDFLVVLCRITVDLSTVCAMLQMVTSLYRAELKARCVCVPYLFQTVTLINHCLCVIFDNVVK